MKPSSTSSSGLDTAAKVLRRGGFCLAVVGVFILLVRAPGQSEADERPITAAMYAAGFSSLAVGQHSSARFFIMHPEIKLISEVIRRSIIELACHHSSTYL